ncbi:alpha/beta hydrolase [Actinomadura sp. 6N118]|uniref:alpha/beta hydrolase n=1 Tax=Actinomadura sp. 6N118 TaxID=3375151 RepID=UPI0037995CDC
MANFVLIPGGGSGPWYWSLLVDELRARGHDGVAVDLPSEDDSAGLSEYADAAVDAIGDRRDLVVVGHSLGGFTAPLVCARVPVDLLVMLTAMIPAPGETANDWWANTGHESLDGDTFFHDVPPELAAESTKDERDQSGTPMGEPWPLPAWPDVPTRFLLCSEDRFFPAEFMRRVVKDRLGVTPDEIATGHMPMLARPKELADRLISYVT